MEGICKHTVNTFEDQYRRMLLKPKDHPQGSTSGALLSLVDAEIMSFTNG